MKKYAIILVVLLVLTTGCSKKNEVVVTTTTSSISTTSTTTTTTTQEMYNTEEYKDDITSTSTTTSTTSTKTTITTTTTTTTTKATNSNTKKEPVKLYVFYGDGCPHCTALHEFLDTLKEDENYKDKFRIVNYEVWYNETNSDYQDRVAAYFQIDSTGVPFYIIGDKTFLGYAARFNDEIKATIDEAYNTQAKDIVSTIK